VAGKAGLKAGLVGTAVMLVWTVIGRFLPMSGGLVWVSAGVSLLMYAGIGVLAGFFLAPPRTPGKGAGAGAIAGLVSGVIAGVVGVVIMTIQLASGGDVPGLNPQQMQQMQQLTEGGMDPTMFALFALPSVVCIMAIGSGLAAIGGAVFAAVKPD
jgi:hypothetical protein